MSIQPDLSHSHTGILWSLYQYFKNSLSCFITDGDQNLLVVFELLSDISCDFLIHLIPPVCLTV